MDGASQPLGTGLLIKMRDHTAVFAAVKTVQRIDSSNRMENGVIGTVNRGTEIRVF